nr:MAG TPA: hypothetical protein [Caudoviricetes sp.]
MGVYSYTPSFFAEKTFSIMKQNKKEGQYYD